MFFDKGCCDDKLAANLIPECSEIGDDIQTALNHFDNLDLVFNTIVKFQKHTHDQECKHEHDFYEKEWKLARKIKFQKRNLEKKDDEIKMLNNKVRLINGKLQK